MGGWMSFGIVFGLEQPCSWSGWSWVGAWGWSLSWDGRHRVSDSFWFGVWAAPLTSQAGRGRASWACFKDSPWTTTTTITTTTTTTTRRSGCLFFPQVWCSTTTTTTTTRRSGSLYLPQVWCLTAASPPSWLQGPRHGHIHSSSQGAAPCTGTGPTSKGGGTSGLLAPLTCKYTHPPHPVRPSHTAMALSQPRSPAMADCRRTPAKGTTTT